MVKLIVGVKGTGKTKQLIELVNKALETSNGGVVCIERDKKLTYDVNYKARLISTAQYGVDTFAELHGFVCGILAGNFDVTDLFIDSALKIGGGDVAEFEKFVKEIEGIAAAGGHEVNIVMTVSADPAEMTEALKQYM